MVPSLHVVAWGRTVPWAESRQVEQDQIISLAVVAPFDDPFLRRELRFRGGTALNKLHFPAPMRYSEDVAGSEEGSNSKRLPGSIRAGRRLRPSPRRDVPERTNRAGAVAAVQTVIFTKNFCLTIWSY